MFPPCGIQCGDRGPGSQGVFPSQLPDSGEGEHLPSSVLPHPRGPACPREVDNLQKGYNPCPPHIREDPPLGCPQKHHSHIRGCPKRRHFSVSLNSGGSLDSLGVQRHGPDHPRMVCEGLPWTTSLSPWMGAAGATGTSSGCLDHHLLRPGNRVRSGRHPPTPRMLHSCLDQGPRTS